MIYFRCRGILLTPWQIAKRYGWRLRRWAFPPPPVVMWTGRMHAPKNIAGMIEL